MRAIVIDVRKKEIREENCPTGLTSTLAFLQKVVEGFIECVIRLKNRDVLYVNEEGLFLSFPNPGWFLFQGYGSYPLTGNGVIMGVNEEGDTVDAASTLDEIRKRVVFLDQLPATSVGHLDGSDGSDDSDV